MFKAEGKQAERKLQEFLLPQDPGGGRHRSAAILRELLMDWYSIIRHSVDSKIMVRFPKQVLVVKAQMLQQGNLAACLRRSVQQEPVEMNSKRVTSLLHEYRISHLMPNRKYKVARLGIGGAA